MKNNLKISLIALSTLLTACGGGSGNSVPNTTLPNTAEVNKAVVSELNEIDILKNNNIEISLDDFNNSIEEDDIVKIIKSEGNNEVNLILAGKQADLSYGNFGYIEIKDKETGVTSYETFSSFVPGEYIFPDKNITFKGNAYASLSGLDNNDKLVSGSAELNVNPDMEKEELNVKFDNWYNLSVKTEGEDGRATASLSKGDNFKDNGYTFDNDNISNPLLEVIYKGASSSSINEAIGNFEISDDNKMLKGSFGVKK